MFFRLKWVSGDSLGVVESLLLKVSSAGCLRDEREEAKRSRWRRTSSARSATRSKTSLTLGEAALCDDSADTSRGGIEPGSWCRGEDGSVRMGGGRLW